ncbi:MAG: thioredoxin family protein [Mycoplasmoidaceae bacterium]|nr:thioredoxin family protein [Mycoplasmoidaceae bacterium]
MLATQLEAFAKKHNDWTIVRVNSDQHQDIAAKFNVQAIPTMVFVKDKKVQEIVVGFKPLIEIEKITDKY